MTARNAKCASQRHNLAAQLVIQLWLTSYSSYFICLAKKRIRVLYCAHVRKLIYIGKLVLLDQIIYFNLSVRANKSSVNLLHKLLNWSNLFPKDYTSPVQWKVQLYFFPDRLVVLWIDFCTLICLPYAISFGMRIKSDHLITRKLVEIQFLGLHSSWDFFQIHDCSFYKMEGVYITKKIYFNNF